MTQSIGRQVNAWIGEFQASRDLQFRFGTQAAFVNDKLRRTFEGSDELKASHGDLAAFVREAKREASRLLTDQRAKASRDEALAQAATARRGTVGNFVRSILSRD